MRPNASCIAWWHLSVGGDNAHCFIGVFVHNVSSSFHVCVADGLARLPSFAKDHNISKRGVWDFDERTCRKVLARVMKYAATIRDERRARGFEVETSSYNRYTGTSEDAFMRDWCDQHDADYMLSRRETPRPPWWPTTNNLTWELSRGRKPHPRELVDTYGFDLVQLIKEAPEVRRRKKPKNVYRRVGRFSVIAKKDT